MKKALKHGLIILTALLYGSVMSLYGGVPLQTVNGNLQHAPVSGSHFTALPVSDLLCHTLQLKSFSGAGFACPCLIKNTVQETVFAQLHTARISACELTSYSFYSDYLIRRFEKPDIVFPFHSYW